MSDNYQEKYLKYKSKYLKLKAKEIQEGSAIDFKSKLIGFFLSDSQLELAQNAWVSERKKISFFKSLDPGDFVLHFDDFVKLKGINHKSYFVNFAEPAKSGIKNAKLAMTTVEETYAWNDKQFSMSIVISEEYANFNLLDVHLVDQDGNPKLEVLNRIINKIRENIQQITQSFQQHGGVTKADIDKQRIEALIPKHILLVRINALGSNKVMGLYTLDDQSILKKNDNYKRLGKYEPDKTKFDYVTLLGKTERGLTKTTAAVSDTASGLYSPLETTRRLKNLEKFVEQLKISKDHFDLIYNIKNNKLNNPETLKLFADIIKENIKPIFDKTA